MTLDYYNQNSLRKYPFKDACSLQAGNGTRLPDDCFVDAQITAHLPDYQRAYLKQLSSDGTTLTIVVAPINFAGTSEYQSVTITKSVSSLVVYDTLVYDDRARLTVKLVVGPGFPLVAAQSFNWSFTIAEAEFASSAVPLYQPRVSALTVENVNTSNNQPTTLVTFDASHELVLQIGTNMVITGDDAGMQWSVEPGKGA
ncbi:MAG: hypothetical protein EBU46_06755, partial [Nitrosomonadaceae bacterium]|nr:hypothetical protein [Nitrosomonadaceae bacterium]